jgi:hypothetical protein
MKLHDVAQRSPEWFALRAGKLTGSSAKDILAKGRNGGEAVTRRDLKFRLVAERLSGQPQEDTFVNAAMQWGIDHEAEAIAAYEAARGCFVDAVGFCEHDSLLAGTSPDGLIGTSGILSVKCPKTSTHIRYLRDGLEPSEHAAQNTHELWLTGREWIDFVSYDPRLSEGLRLFIVRVTRPKVALDQYEREALDFLEEVRVECEGVQSLAFREAVA